MDDTAQMRLDTVDPAVQCMPSFVLPQDQERLERQYGRIRESAEAWGESFSTARRLIDAHPAEVGRQVVWIVTTRGASARVVVTRGAQRPQAQRGNPGFHDPASQKALAARRWQKAGDKNQQA